MPGRRRERESMALVYSLDRVHSGIGRGPGRCLYSVCAAAQCKAMGTHTVSAGDDQASTHCSQRWTIILQTFLVD